jgi:ribonuclease HI
VASGQAISLPKSEIFYSRNVSDALKNNITNILQVRAVLGTSKYLGMPSMIGRDRTATFAYIKDRVWQRINSWSSKWLSKAGREVMIKSVLQAIPSYVMSLFQLPTTLIASIERMMNSFWWGHGRSTHRGINWLSWEKLSIHKNHGGLGFKDLSAFNLGMLGKQGWKFLTEPQSLVSRIFKARYFPSKSFLNATIGHNPSYVWRSILRARFIVRGGGRWSIGSGSNIPILDAPWLSNGASIDGNIEGSHYVRDFTVHNLISEHGKVWNEPLIRQVFSTDIADAILHTPLFEQVTNDRLIWKAEKNGCYSVRSAYRLCVEELIDVSHLHRPGNWKSIWRLKLPPKVKHLLWRMCRGCLPTRVRLQDKGVSCPTQCASCDSNFEDLNHLLFECPFSIQVWQSAGIWFDIQNAAIHTDSAVNFIFYLLENLTPDIQQRFGTICWSLWKHRNLKIWEDVTENSAHVVDRARQLLQEWQDANLPRATAGLSTDVQQQHFSLPLQQQPAVIEQQQRGQQQRGQHALSRTGLVSAQWSPPSSGRYKCNVDAAFSDRFQRTGIGICIRDESGIFVLAKVLQFGQIYPVAIGEALGLYHAIQWLQDMRFDNIDFELDSKITRDAFHSRTVDVTEFGTIIGACQNLFSSSFTNSRVEFIRRQANAAAHALAREATSLASPTIYYVIPHCIETIIINEML